MRRLTILILSFTIFSFSANAQLEVATHLESNKLTATSYIDGSTNQDLFFSISPDGRPQYGKTVNWNLYPQTDDEGRFYYARKGDFDRDDLVEEIKPIKFVGLPLYPPNETPNIDMTGLFVKLSTSWNFASDNYNIAIVSIHNNSSDKIHHGDVLLQVPGSMQPTINEVKVYNHWGQTLPIINNNGDLTIPFQIADLQVGEIRHYYVYVDIPRVPSKFKRKRHTLEAEFVGYGTSQIQTDLINPPHDPNELYLLNAIDNSMEVNNCSIFYNYPELEERCDLGLPYWYLGPEKPCAQVHPCNVKAYTFEYPYCAHGSEILEYRIQCLNDGTGFAKDIGKVVKLEGVDYLGPFQEESFSISGNTHSVDGHWTYPDANFFYSNINLPGLGDTSYVRTYNECTAFVSFKLETKCQYKSSIKGKGAIEFFDTAGQSVGIVETSVVKTNPNINPTYEFYQQCLPCFTKDDKSPQNPLLFNVNQTRNSLKIAPLEGWDGGDIIAQIFHISGKNITTKNFGNRFKGEGLKMPIDGFPSGAYVLTLTQLNNVISHKFVIP